MACIEVEDVEPEAEDDDEDDTLHLGDCVIHHGEALEWLRFLPDGYADARRARQRPHEARRAGSRTSKPASSQAVAVQCLRHRRASRKISASHATHAVRPPLSRSHPS